MIDLSVIFPDVHRGHVVGSCVVALLSAAAVLAVSL